jgi:hypothetical protein
MNYRGPTGVFDGDGFDLFDRPLGRVDDRGRRIDFKIAMELLTD